MGVVGAQALLPYPRTDQYFSSKGTKHLVEQLLLKSFTHWIGTPLNTQPYCQCACVQSREFQGCKSYCWGDNRERWEPLVGGRFLFLCGWLIPALCGVYRTDSYFTFTSLTADCHSLFSLSTCKSCHARAHARAQREFVPKTLISALPGGFIWDRETDRQRKKFRLVLCFSRLWHVNSNLTILNLKSGTLPPPNHHHPFIVVFFLHSAPFVMHLQHSQCACSLSVKIFREALQNVWRP